MVIMSITMGSACSTAELDLGGARAFDGSRKRDVYFEIEHQKSAEVQSKEVGQRNTEVLMLGEEWGRG